jgi:hypothetical protein
MAYARWGAQELAYYIFWMISDAQRKEDEVLAIWHQTRRGYGPGSDFKYSEVQAMLERNDFSSVAGFETADADFLRANLLEFIADTDQHYAKTS